MRTMRSPHELPRSLSRRDWLATGLFGSLALAAGSQASAAASPAESPAERPISSDPLTRKKEAKLRLSSWWLPVPGDIDAQLAFLEKAGMEGVELRGGVLKEPAKYKTALAKTKLVATALDWSNCSAICSDDETAKKKSLDDLKRAIEIAHDFKAPNIIVVPPRLKSQFRTPEARAARQTMLEVLPKYGELAHQAGTCLTIEPVSRNSVVCLHTVAEVAAFCRELNSPGIGIVADYSIMAQEETNLSGAFISGGSYIRQVHLSSRRRRLPGQESEDTRLYAEGFRGMKAIGYQNFCSFESGMFSGFCENLAASVAFLRQQWDLA